MSPVLSKEGKSDGSWYKKIEKYEKHEESGLSRFLFPLDETGSVHLSHPPTPHPFFFGCPWKRPNCTHSSPSHSLSLDLPLSRYLCLSLSFSVFLSLVSSDTLVSLRVEEQRDSAMGLLEEMEGRRGEKWGGKRGRGEERKRSGMKKRGGRSGQEEGGGGEKKGTCPSKEYREKSMNQIWSRRWPVIFFFFSGFS